jgi:hypothetical protein
MGSMGLGGRLIGCLSLLAALGLPATARADEGEFRLVFDASAAGLAEEEVRAAVEKEIGRPVVMSRDEASGDLVILVDAGRLIVRYRTEVGSVERYLPMPSEPNDVPLIVSLAARNLVQDQADRVPPEKSKPAPISEPVDDAELEESDVPRVAPKPATSPPKEPALKRHWVGLHAAQDIAWVHGQSVCQRESVEPPDAFFCYYEGPDEAPFFHDSQNEHGNFEGGATFATTRLLISYDFAIIPKLSVGTRLGYAFGGGPPADQEPVEIPPNGNKNLLPAGAQGRGGNPFLPLHAELRANLWFLPLTNRWLRAYVGGSFGMAQVDSKHSVVVTDCAETLDTSWNSANGTFHDCVMNTEDWQAELPPTTLVAWNNLGRFFVGANAGAAVSLTAELSVVLNLNAMQMFPTSGFVLEPSLGVMTSVLDGFLVSD